MDPYHPAHVLAKRMKRNEAAIDHAIEHAKVQYEIGQSDAAAELLDELWFQLGEVEITAVQDEVALLPKGAAATRQWNQFAQDWATERERIELAYTNVLAQNGPFPVDTVRNYANYLTSQRWGDYAQWWRDNTP